MSDTEKIMSFGETVEAAGKLSKPWIKAFFVSNIIHLIVELALCIIIGLMVYMAYMEPVEYGQEQGQYFDESTQTQSNYYTENAAHGD